MNKKFEESAYYQDWIHKAERDSDTAFLNHRHGGYTDVTCYFCHQAVEKILKAYLLQKGAKYLPRTHILPSLAARCREHDKAFSEIEEECQILDRYYIEAKYPAAPVIDYPQKEAEVALELAEKVLEFAQKRLAPKI